MPIFPAGPASVAPPGPGDATRLAAGFWRRLAAGCGVLIVAAELALAPVALACTVVLLMVARLTRWQSVWLTLPAVTGVGWAVLEGPGPAAAGFAAGGAHLVAFLAASGSVPDHLTRLPAAITRWRAGLPGQFPLALVTAAAQTTIAGEVRARIGPGGSRARGYSGGTEAAGRIAAGRDSPVRPGLVCAARRAYLTAMLRRGEVATVDGACLGIEPDTGRRASLSWAEVAGGVLVTGSDPGAVTRSGLELAVAAIQHRKAVIIVDLGGQPGPVAATVAAVCSDRRAPLRTLSRPPGPARAVRACPRWPGGAGSQADEPGGGATDADGAADVGPAGLAAVLSGRQVLLVQPGSRAPDLAAGPARFVADGLAAALAGRRELGVPADCLAWINGCDQVGREALSALLAQVVPEAGGAVVLGTAAGPAAGWLAGQVAVVAIRGRPPRGLAHPDAVRTGPDAEVAGGSSRKPAGWAAAPAVASGPEIDPAVLPARLLAGQRDTDLSLLVRAPVPRLSARCRAVR